MLTVVGVNTYRNTSKSVFLAFSQDQHHIDFSRHGETDRVAHLQACYHLVFVGSPTANFPGDLHNQERQLKK